MRSAPFETARSGRYRPSQTSLRAPFPNRLVAQCPEAPSLMHRPRRGAVAADQVGDIEPGNRTVNDSPFAADHHAVGTMRAAQHQCRQRIAVAGETQFVELEQGEVGGLADRDLAEFGAADAGRRALGRPAQRVLVADAGDAVARPLQQERCADLLHQVRFVVRGRAVDAEPDRIPPPLPSRRPDSSPTPESGCCRRNG